MRAISVGILVALCVGGGALADPPVGPPIGPSATAPAAPVAVQPPGPPELAPLSPDFQAAMANSQLATYRYTQLAEQALALKKLCDTGFGPADICPKIGIGAGQPSASAVQGELPMVTEITGGKSGLSAVLALPDGRRVVVHPGTRLPDGSRVAGISHDDVRIARTGADDLALSFAGADLK
jgi:type IV pilus biogenesis protein PilP